jgi:hypothetical protein
MAREDLAEPVRPDMLLVDARSTAESARTHSQSVLGRSLLTSIKPRRR